MTIKEFLEKMESDPALLALYLSDPDAACVQEGLTEKQCKVLKRGDLNKIRDEIAEESPPTKGLFIKVVM